MRPGFRIDWLLVTLFAVPVIPFCLFLFVAIDPELYRLYDFALAALFGALTAGAVFVSGVHVLEGRRKALSHSLLAVTMILLIAGVLTHRGPIRDGTPRAEENVVPIARATICSDCQGTEAAYP